MLAIPLLAPLLGGSVERWSQGAILVSIGILGLLRPPRRLPRGLLPVSAAFLTLGAVGLLPAHWFPIPPWRSSLAALGADLPGTASGQPWLTADALLLLLGGIIWFSWLAAQQWTSSERTALLSRFAFGMVTFAAVVVVFYLTKYLPPFWEAPSGIGPFPNRNQTGNLFALGGLTALGCTSLAWSRGSRIWPLWLAGFALLALAVVLVGSRAGVGVLLGGAAVWMAVLFAFSRSWRHLAVGASAVLLMASFFLLFGGKTLERFRGLLGGGETELLGFRRLIFQDACRMAGDGPWAGAGLGNFHAIFPFFRTATAGQVTFLHPESDWLWVGAEMGWGGVALLALGLGLVLRCTLPLDRKSDRRLRSVCLVAGLAFLAHGFVDVSGHRLGTVLPALFIFSLALRPELSSPVGRFTPAIFRCCSALLLFVGAVWLGGTWLGWRLPGGLGAARAKQDAEAFLSTRRFDQASRSATQALQWAPLDWQIYFTRGAAKAYARDISGAQADFRIARGLQPFMTAIVLAEGRVWMDVQPALALPLWEETLRHAPVDQAPSLYRQMFSATRPEPSIRVAVGQLAGDNPALRVIYLAQANPAQASELIEELLASDPGLRRLDDSGKQVVFETMGRSLPLSVLEDYFAAQPALLPAGWPVLARRLAAEKRYAEASRLALAHLPSPALPPLSTTPPPAELQRRVLLDGSDFASAYALYRAQLNQQDESGAFTTLRRTAGNPRRPAYFAYLEAQARARRNEWAPAWVELEKLLPSGR